VFVKKLFDEFKAFALGGNLIEIAVGLVLALAFAAVVGALVDFLIMPIVGIIFGEPSFNGLVLTINDSVIFYGSFLTEAVKFLLIALALFLFVVKPYNAWKARTASGEEEPPPPPEDIALLREIRDSLKSRS
jgi:large conductance mechanosensitive channel